MAKAPETLYLHVYCICGEMFQVALDEAREGALYTIGGVKDRLVSVYLHRDQGQCLSRIQCHIKLVREKWTLFDGIPAEIPLMALPGGAKEDREPVENTYYIDDTAFSQRVKTEKDVDRRWRRVPTKGVALDPGKKCASVEGIPLPASVAFGFVRKPKRDTVADPAPVYGNKKHLWYPGEPGEVHREQVPFAYFIEVRRGRRA